MCFMVTPNGPGCVHIKVLYLDQCTGNNGHIEKTGDRPDGGWVYVTYPGESRRRYVVALYNENKQSDDKDDYAMVHMRFSQRGESTWANNGNLFITNPYSGKNVEVGYSQREYKLKKPKGDARCFAEFDWYYPVELAGKELKFFITASVSHGSNLNERGFTGNPYICSSVPNLNISDPVFNPTGENAGYFSLLVSNTTGAELKIKRVLEKQTVNGIFDKDITTDCKSSSDGYSLLIPSASYKRQVVVDAQVPYSTYQYYDMPRKTVDLDALHDPKDFTFTAEWGREASSVLKWTVPNANEKDALPTDVFIIQRQLYNVVNGNNTDEDATPWETIDQVVMEEGKENYECVDSMMGCYGDSAHNSVRYRLYRVALGSDDNHTVQCEMKDKRSKVVRDKYRISPERDDQGVRITIACDESDEKYCIHPERFRAYVIRTAKYHKKGELLERTKKIDMSSFEEIYNKIVDGRRSWKYLYSDNEYAPCTKYSYTLCIEPNDPAGVLKKKYEYQIYEDIEPVKDDTKIGDFKASNDVMQDRIHLQWAIDMDRIDTLIVQKLDKNKWENLPIDTKLRYFDDFDVEAGQDVKYRIIIKYECTDGEKILYVDATGKRRATGRIAGFLTFKDGTGLADVDVQLLQEKDGKEILLETVKTTVTGAYTFPDVPYSDLPYIIRPKTTLYPDLSPAQYPVYLNKKQTEFFNKDFISDDAFDIDGYVYYENTTVPVYGASFKIDGQDVTDKSGNVVISDNDGHFSFKVRKGSKQLTAQKKGHTFMFGGLYADNNGKARAINSNQTNVFFWDQTKVHTIGRMVGGLDQGDKTLGFGLSRNNLGDDLRIVLELEGNQRSWLVKDQRNDALTVVHDTLAFETTTGKKTSTVTTERHRVIISPNIETGEYQADLLPVRYKVVEVSAKGYPSLFQKGKVSEVLDLTDSLTQKTITGEDQQMVNYNAIYNRIYRIEPSVNIVELDTKTGDVLPNVGLSSYTEIADDGVTPVEVPIYDAKSKTYTFGYPVLMAGKHDFRISATENYYYNGLQTGRCDSVPLRSGQVQVYDDFAAIQHDTLCVLNPHTGETVISVDVQNTVYDVQGTNALRHIDVTLEHEGKFIDGESLRAFVMGAKQVTDDVMSADGIIEVTDIIRDPQGSRSYAWVDKESVYQSQFNFDVGLDIGLKLGYETGTRSNLVTGGFAGTPSGTFMGTTTVAKTTFAIGPKTIPIIGYHYTYNGSVTFQLNERIQTSNDPAFVGANGDVYCGYELVAASSFIRNVRAVNEATYLYLKGAGLFSEEDGACHLIAEGKTDVGTPYYLISDYTHKMGPKIKSDFAYTQDYILNTLLPKLRTARNSYLYKGTREQAQAKANATLRNVCFSLRAEDDPRYGQDNRDDSLDYISIDRYDEYRDRLNYEVITPNYVKVLKLEKQLAEQASATDSVRILNRQIAQWEYIVALNEAEKIHTFAEIDNDKSKREKEGYDIGTPYNVKNQSYYVDNHSISGGVSYNHAETFTSKEKSNHKVPVLGFDFADLGSKQGMQYFNKVINGAFSVVEDGLNSHMTTVSNDIANKRGWNTGEPEVKVKYRSDPNNPVKDQTAIFSGQDLQNGQRLASLMRNSTDVSVEAVNTYTKVTITPVVDLTYNVNSDESTNTTTYRGYELATDADSHLSIDIYHDVKTVNTGINVFGSATETRTLSQGNYIFRAIGGATKCPHDEGDVTHVYLPGERLSAPTAYVEKPRITVENHIISNVPYGETAKFNLVLSNDGTVREEGSFDLVLLDKTNQVGASLVMDGAPLGNGRSLVVPYGTGMVKVLEIGQGLVDDYENIRLALRSQCDPSVADTVSLSVHYVPSASPIAVISPQDKWVMNTNSAQDERGRYYMPVTVSGFDVNFRNFDHVELQYKQSSEPESRWTNLCSYYNVDSLYEKGAGTKAMLTGGTLTHAFYGDSDPVELKYDLRAVTYSRLGNDFVTNSTPVFSGIKDTRRPRIFGSPQPANGILGVGDDLKLVFSEDINANRLLATNNFKVTGLPNNCEIGTTTYLYLPGDASSYLETETEYSPSNESFTVDMMLKADAAKKQVCELFEHYYNNETTKGFSIELTYLNNEPMLLVKSKRDAIVQQSISAKLDDIFSDFQRIVVVFNRELKQVFIYKNDKLLVQSELIEGSENIQRNGKMRFGKSFAGNLMETRVWSKALTAEDIEETAGKTMYGNEVDLLAYYPMDEGFGMSLEDKAHGNNLTMQNVQWVTPQGGSLRLEGKYFEHELKREMFERTSADKSYTLALWFKAKAKENFPIMASGYGVKDEPNAKEKLFVGVKNSKLTISCDTTSIVMTKSYADDNWHQLTFVVDRSSNIASAYVDGKLTGQTQAMGFGKLYGAAPFCLGQVSVNNDEAPLESLDYMEGFIDEITLWDMALPRNVIKQRMNVSHDGAEPGLLAYIPFNEDIRQITGSGTKMEFSTKYFSNKWDTELQKIVSISDDAFGTGSKVTESMKSVQESAAVNARGAVRDLRFDFVTKGNEMIIDLKELPKDIDRTTVNITAMGIEDLNGNEMAQPVTWSAFIDRNSVRWAESQKTIEIDAQKNEDYTFTIDINNHGGAFRSYTIESLPEWMTIEEGVMGTLEPEETATLHVTISKDININTYNEVIYLKNDEELVNPLNLTIKTIASAPEWAFNKNSQSSMQLVTQVKKGDFVVTNKESIVAAFDEYDKCLGKGHVTIDQNGKALFYLNVFGEKKDKAVFFRLWDAVTGITYGLTPDHDITYKADSIVGSYDKPVVMITNSNITRSLALTPTWTWVSLNVASPFANDINQFMKRGTWQDGDQLKDPEAQSYYNYYRGIWNNNGVTEALRTDRMYYIKSQKPQTIYLEGRMLTEEADHTITLHPKWNYIGYTLMVNLPINDALEDLKDKASDGDIIKSQDEFATFAASVGGWRGNLQYMKPGKGYMLYHKVTPEHPEKVVKFVYPYEGIVGTWISAKTCVEVEETDEALWTNTRSTTMNLILRTKGIVAEEGDRLYTYADGELCGIAESMDVDGEQTFFLSVGSDEKKALSFTLERDGKLLGAATHTGITYQPDEVEGTTDVPKVIDFSETSAYETGIWYTLAGIRVGTHRPTIAGAYIFNGQIVMIP